MRYQIDSDYNSVMIVDDEILALNHLESLVDWEALKCRLVARCDNGQQAVAQFRQKKPTIIVADISMPEMNGIEMMERILAFGIPVRFIFLTAYREFDYIQEAMHLGASGFILKHDLSAALLGQELGKAARGLALELHHSPGGEAAAGNATRELPALVEADRLFPVVGGISTLAFAPPVAQLRRIDYHAYRYIDYAQVAADHQGRYTLHLSIKAVYSQLAFLEELRRFYSQIQEMFAVSAGTTISVASMALPAEAGALAAKTEQLNHLLDQRFFLGRGRLLFLENNPTLQPGAWATPEELSTFGAALRSGGDNTPLLAKLFRQTLGSMPQFSALVRALTDAMNRVRAERGEPSLEEIHSIGGLDTSLWYNCTGVETWFAQESASLAGKAAHLRAHPSSKSLQGLELLDRHYREDISLEWLAGQLDISSVYLLKLFKRETGCTFTELLTRRRMKAATEILAQSRMKTREVAKQLGYHSSQYFATVFKKHYGCTPQEYRRNGGKQP